MRQAIQGQVPDEAKLTIRSIGVQNALVMETLQEHPPLSPVARRVQRAVSEASESANERGSFVRRRESFREKVTTVRG